MDGWQESLACSSKINLDLAVDSSCWRNFSQWKASMLSDTPSKAKLKFTLVVEYLSSHPLLHGRNCSLEEMLRMVVCKVVVHYVCKLYSSEPRPPHAAPLYSSLPQSFLHPRRVLAAASPSESPTYQHTKSLSSKDRLHAPSCRCALVRPSSSASSSSPSSSRKRFRDLLPLASAQGSLQCVYQCSTEHATGIGRKDYAALYPYCQSQSDKLDDFNLNDLDLNPSIFDDLSYDGDIITNESCVTDCDESQIFPRLSCEHPSSQCSSITSTPSLGTTTCSCCSNHSDLGSSCELFMPLATFAFAPSNSAHISEQPVHYVARKMPRVENAVSR